VNAAAREAKYMRNGETSCKCPGADGKKQSTGIKGPMLAAMVIAGLLLWYVVYGKLKPAADFITYRLRITLRIPHMIAAVRASGGVPSTALVRYVNISSILSDSC
jgi:hypothetical protein